MKSLIPLLALVVVGLTASPEARAQRYPGLVSLAFEASGKCLDVPDAAKTPVPLTQSVCQSGESQQFRILEAGNNTYSLTAASSSLCVDIPGSSRASGAVVQQYFCNGTDAQRFALRDAGGGRLRLEAVVSGLCVEVEGGTPDDGVRIVQTACGDKPSQRISMVPITFRPKADLPVASVGRAYSYAFGAAGVASYRFAVSDGSLPPGMSLAASGLLSGSPTQAGNYAFTITATGSDGKTLTDVVRLSVGPASNVRVVAAAVGRTPIPGNACTPPALESEFLTIDPNVWVVFQISGTNAGEKGGIEWILPSGDVYSSPSISGNGCWYWTIPIAGSAPSQIPGTWRARLVWNGSEVFSFPFRISAPAPTGTLNFLSSTVLPNAALGQAYSFTFTASGGTTPYTWSVASGALPPGLALSAGGVLSGTPTAIGSSIFTIRLQDSAGAAVTRSVGLGVGAPALSLTPGSLSFNYTRGAAVPAAQTVSVRSSGAAVNYSSSRAFTNGSGWFSVTPASGSTPGTLSVAVAPGNLAAGTYRGTLTVSSANATPGSTSIPVTLVVEDPLPPGQFRPLISTYAGTDWVFPFNGARATSAPLGSLYWIAVDAQDNVLVANPDDNIVVRIRTDGSYETIAGNGIRGFTGDGGQATGASLNNPGGIAADKAGNIYIADSGNHRIRRITPDGVITTIAGLRAGYGGDGGPALNALINFPTALLLAPDGSLFVCDGGNNLIRRIAPDGSISTYAGNRQPGSTGDGGSATAAAIEPGSMALDTAGNLYFSESNNHKVRRVTPDGVVQRVAGTGTRGSAGDNGQALAATLNNPTGLAFDAAQNLYISEFNGAIIRRVSPEGVTSTYAGARAFGFSPDGTPALQARFTGNFGLAMDSAGNLYVADRDNFRIRVIDTALRVSTRAGNGQYRNAPDGTSLSGSFFNGPRGIAFDPKGNLIVVDQSAQRVRRLDVDGTFHTIAGTGGLGTVGNGTPLGSAFNGPVGVAVSPEGVIFVADTFNRRITRIEGNRYTVYAGNGAAAFAGDNGPALAASLNAPHGLALDGAGNLYIADELNHRIRRVSAAGIITTVAGTGTAGSSGDNGPAVQATIRNPYAVALDKTGNLYIAESAGHVVRRVDLGGVITTIAGTGRAGFGGDGGPARSALLNAPAALAFDGAGNLYIGERDGHRVRRVDSNGVITTVAGTGVAGFSGDGGPATQAQLSSPNGGLAVDGAGTLYMSDTANNRIRVITAGAATLQTSTTTLSFRATSNGPSSEGQTLAVSGSNLGLPYSVAARTASGGGWLRVSPTSGNLPASISIYADPTNVAAGTYNGTLTISAPNATSVTVAVTFTVAAANPPKLGYDPASLSFSIPENGNAEQVVFVSNLGGGTLTFNVGQAQVAWLTTSPLAAATGGLGSCPNCTNTSSGGGGVRLAASAAGLAPGIYRTSVSLANPATNETAQVPVTLTVTPSGRPSMRVSQTGLTFRLISGFGATAQCFAVLNLGQGTLDFGVTADSPWINVRRGPCPYRAVSSTTPIPEVVVEMRPDGLAPGDYDGQIQVAASNAENPTQNVAVRLKVLPSGSALGPDVYPTGLVFSSAAGGSTPGSLGVVVNNISERPFDFYSNSGFETESWFTYQPRSGVVRPTAPGETGTVITVQPDIRNLGAGLYYGFLTLGTREYGVRSVNALLALSGGGKSTRAAGGCPDGSVSLIHTAASQDFVAVAGQAFPLEVYATDGCDGPLANGSVIATFSNGDPAVTLTALGDGRWAGTWIPAQGSGSSVTITIRGSDGTVQGQLPLIGRVQ